MIRESHVRNHLYWLRTLFTHSSRVSLRHNERILLECYEWWLSAVDIAVEQYGCVVQPLPGVELISVYAQHQCLAQPAGLFSFLADWFAIFVAKTLKIWL